MGDVFEKLGCYAKKVIIDKVDDDTLEICVEDEIGDEHNLKVGVVVETCQNVDTFGDKEGYTTDVPSLGIDYSVKKTDKLNSTDISMKWNHSNKPSVFEIRNKDEVAFSGTYSDAMEWVGKNVIECSQPVVVKKSQQ